MQSNLIFISTPYSHSDPLVQDDRFELACKLVANLLNQDKFPISPIVHGHPTTKYDVRGDWQFWTNYCHEFINVCSVVYVANMDGWQQSTGVKSEIEYAKSIGKEVYLINYKNAEIIEKI